MRVSYFVYYDVTCKIVANCVKLPCSMTLGSDSHHGAIFVITGGIVGFVCQLLMLPLTPKLASWRTSVFNGKPNNTYVVVITDEDNNLLPARRILGIFTPQVTCNLNKARTFFINSLYLMKIHASNYVHDVHLPALLWLFTDQFTHINHWG